MNNIQDKEKKKQNNKKKLDGNQIEMSLIKNELVIRYASNTNCIPREIQSSIMIHPLPYKTFFVSLNLGQVFLCFYIIFFYFRPKDVEPEEAVESGKLRCPAPITRLKVEKIEGGLMVAGVVVAANCQIILPIFGFLFLLVGCVLTGKLKIIFL